MKKLSKTVAGLFLSLAFMLTSPGRANALGIPVADPGTIAQCMLNNVKMMLEAPFFQNVMNMAGTMNTTVGTAKSNFSNLLNKGAHGGDGNDENGEYDQDYDHIPDNKVPGPEDAIMDLEDLGLNLSPQDLQRNPDLQLASNANTIYASATVSGSTRVASAKKAYSGLVKIGNENRYVFPDELAEFCEITPKEVSNIKNKTKMIECLKKLLRFRNSPIQSDQREARDIFFRAQTQGAYANAAEALVTRNFAVHYDTEVTEPMVKKASKAKEERDDFAVLMSANKEIARLMNRLYNVYGMRVANDTLRDYGDFQLYAEEFVDKPEEKNPKGTIGNVFIFPKEIADYCSIDVKDIDTLEEKPILVDCLKRLILLRREENQSTKREARDIYVRAYHQQMFANYSESLVDRVYSLKYEAGILDPIAEIAISSKTEKKDADTVIKTNKEIANMISRLTKVYAMRISYDNLRDYGVYEIYPDELLKIE